MAEEWQNRIIGYAQIPAKLLEPNLLNWRLHPDEQERALLSVLVDVGLVQNVIANTRTMTFTHVEPDETGDDIVDFVRTTTTPPTLEHVRITMPHMIDGHLRLKLALQTNDEATLPVTFTDLTEEEEDKILATYDPLSAMAKIDATIMRTLHERLQVENEDLQTMLTDLADQGGLYTSAFTPVETSAEYAHNPYEDREYHSRKQVTLLLSLEDFALFNDAVKLLGKHYGTDIMVETVMNTLTDAAKTIPEPKVGEKRERVAKEPTVKNKPRDLKLPVTEEATNEAESIPELV